MPKENIVNHTRNYPLNQRLHPVTHVHFIKADPDKEKPVAPNRVTRNGKRVYVCPECNGLVETKDTYCRHCGHKLDFKLSPKKKSDVLTVLPCSANASYQAEKPELGTLHNKEMLQNKPTQHFIKKPAVKSDTKPDIAIKPKPEPAAKPVPSAKPLETPKQTVAKPLNPFKNNPVKTAPVQQHVPVSKPVSEKTKAMLSVDSKIIPPGPVVKKEEKPAVKTEAPAKKETPKAKTASAEKTLKKPAEKPISKETKPAKETVSSKPVEKPAEPAKPKLRFKRPEKKEEPVSKTMDADKAKQDTLEAEKLAKTLHGSSTNFTHSLPDASLFSSKGKGGK